MSDGVYWTFTATCHTCGEGVQVTNGVRAPHPCPEGPALVIEGSCSGGWGSDDLTTRVEWALDDYQAIVEMEGRLRP